MRGVEASLQRRGSLLVWAVVVLLAMPAVARAASYTVNDPGDFALANPSGTSCVSTDGGTCTLRAAVQAADNSGGASAISLPAGTYKLTIPSAGADDPSTGDLDVNNTGNGTAITVAGAGSGSTLIDADHIDRAFAVQIGGGLGLSGLTIEDGSSSSSSSGSQNGGAIYSDGALTLGGDLMLTDNSAGGAFGGAVYADGDSRSSLSVSDTTVESNLASEGGAIYDNSPNTMTIGGSRFNEDVASLLGGALEGVNGGMKIDSSTFTDNSSADGGAIEWQTPPGARESITSSSFDGNSASGLGGVIGDLGSADVATFTSDRFRDSTAPFGGAVYLESSLGARYAFNHDEFDGNSSPGGQGGAMYIDVGINSFSGSSFLGNTADQGGAIYVQAIDELAMVNTTMSDNSATDGGAIDDSFPAPATLTNDTIAFNTAAAGQGGGIDGTSSLMTGSGSAGVENTIIAENGGEDCDATLPPGLDQGHNLDSDSSCLGGLGGTGDKPGVHPLLAAPAANGGPLVGAPASAQTIQTDAELSGSPAIDAGSNSGCPATDERGVSRPQGPACDIGAYEATPPVVTTASATDVNTGSATLNGTVNPANLATSYQFEYGTGTGYGSSTASQSAGFDYAVHDEAAAITGLAPGTTYNFRIVATNAEGTSYGADQTFTTPAKTPPASVKAPVVVTGPARRKGSRSATVTGSVNPNGLAISFHFEYGTSTHHGSRTTTRSTDSSTTGVKVSAHLTGLRPGGIYHYRLVASSAGGTTSGSDRTFHTKAVIVIAGVPIGVCTRTSRTTLRVRVTSLTRGSTTVRLDGRRLARSRRSSLRVRLALSKLRTGRHTITVTTTSRAGTTTRSLRFAVCGTVPVVTG
jgi:hypothetical protein